MCEKKEKQNALAREILLLSRNTLLVNLRFLDAALSRFTLTPIEGSTLLTDGKHLFTIRSMCWKATKPDPGAGLFAYRHALRIPAYVHGSQPEPPLLGSGLRYRR